MAKVVFRTQDKKKIRNNNELLLDLHMHLGRQKPLLQTLEKIAAAVDGIVLTDRGDKYKNKFEYDFESLRRELDNLRVKYEVINEVVLKILFEQTALFIMRGQEINVSENFDVVVVGASQNFKDGISYVELRSQVRDGLFILSTPFQIPNSIRTRKQTDAEVTRLAATADCVEAYNQNLYISRVNRLASKLALTAQKPGIATSDAHLYSRKNLPISLSGVVISKPAVGSELLPHLKKVLSGGQFRTHQVFSPLLIFEFLGLTRAEIHSLYHGHQ
jgi:hypothetical protein